MHVTLADGYTLFVEDVGNGFPVIVLHGGPGMDHTMFRPYLDALGDEYRLLYVDERGQGRSERVDPATLTLEVFARDVDLLAEALELPAFALLGHSFGAIITGWHATELGTGTAYVISGGGESSEALGRDVEESIGRRDDAEVIRESWELEKTVSTEAEMKRLMDMQLPFHFHAPPPKDAFGDTVYSPDVLRHFANIDYGGFDYTAKLGDVAKPTLVIVGEHDPTTTPRAARVLAGGIPNAELEILSGAGHMSFVEANEPYIAAVRRFLSGVASRV
ncbi:MAG: alpha/beta fold hydrolase [Actinomycetota bacterium]|nr:alpha/beta fold hydrolase [Actinomycetota bacterium]